MTTTGIVGAPPAGPPVGADRASGEDLPIAFAIDVPDDWLRLDLNSRSGPQHVLGLIEQAERQDPRLHGHRGRLEREIRDSIRVARRHDLAFCALLVTVVDDVLPLVASLTVGIRPLPVGLELADLAKPDSGWGRFGQLDPPRRFRAEPGGLDGLRIRFRQTAPGGPSGPPARVSVCQYLVSAPTKGQLAVVTGSTPMLALEDAFADLFDAIVGTLRWVPEPPGAARQEVTNVMR